MFNRLERDYGVTTRGSDGELVRVATHGQKGITGGTEAKGVAGHIEADHTARTGCAQDSCSVPRATGDIQNDATGYPAASPLVACNMFSLERRREEPGSDALYRLRSLSEDTSAIHHMGLGHGSTDHV